MKFGFQISIAGGLSKVVDRAKKLGCETIQLFSRNPRSWLVSSLDTHQVHKFKQKINSAHLLPVFIHVPYLVNLASPEDWLWQKSIDSLCIDLERAEKLGVLGVIIHPGHHMGMGVEYSIKRVIQAINLAFERVNNCILLIIENTAGEGSAIGYEFQQIKAIFDGVTHRDKLGVCLDTAHLYQAGYNIATLDGLRDMVDEFHHLIGLNKLCLLHLNDSKTSIGSHHDRHWHIGEGYIGLDGFIRIVNLSAFSGLPGIMETPRTSDREDIRNMEVIRKLKTGGL